MNHEEFAQRAARRLEAVADRSYTMSPHPQYRAYPDERRQAPSSEACLPSCSRTDGRSAAQPVGSFVTKASLALLKILSKAPGVVG
jgi:hypothetical protein